MERLLEVLSNPFAHSPEQEDYSTLPSGQLVLTKPFVVPDLQILMNKPDLLMDSGLVYIWELSFCIYWICDTFRLNSSFSSCVNIRSAIGYKTCSSFEK